jgi:hypothetical protein
MTQFVKQPPAFSLTRWTIGGPDNTDDIASIISDVDTIGVERYDGDSGIVLRFFDVHGDGETGYVCNTGVLWVGLNPNRTIMTDRLITVADDGTGNPVGYSAVSV